MSCCGIVQELPCKLQPEEVILNFNFKKALPNPGDLIIGIHPLVVELMAGEDDNPGAVVGGVPGLADDGVTVQFPFIDGKKGATYLFTVEVDRNNDLPATIQAYASVV